MRRASTPRDATPGQISTPAIGKVFRLTRGVSLNTQGGDVGELRGVRAALSGDAHRLHLHQDGENGGISIAQSSFTPWSAYTKVSGLGGVVGGGASESKGETEARPHLLVLRVGVCMRVFSIVCIDRANRLNKDKALVVALAKKRRMDIIIRTTQRVDESLSLSLCARSSTAPTGWPMKRQQSCVRVRSCLRKRFRPFTER